MPGEDYIAVRGGDSPSPEAKDVIAHFEQLARNINPAFYEQDGLDQSPPVFRGRAHADFSSVRQLINAFPICPQMPDVPVTIRGFRLNDRYCEWAIAEGADQARRVLFLHGGGYSFGNVHTYRPFMARLSQVSGAAVLAVDYRLAPENPFPAGLDDAMAAYAHMIGNAPTGAGAAARTYVVGDSAGGGLALSAALRVRQLGLRLFNAVAAFSPATDLTLSAPSLTEPERQAARGMFSGYCGSAAADDPLISPLFADLEGFPPVLIQVSDVEGMRDDSTRFAAKAHAAGVDVRLELWRHMIHVHQMMTPLLPEANEALESVGTFLQQY